MEKVDAYVEPYHIMYDSVLLGIFGGKVQKYVCLSVHYLHEISKNPIYMIFSVQVYLAIRKSPSDDELNSLPFTGETTS